MGLFHKTPKISQEEAKKIFEYRAHEIKERFNKLDIGDEYHLNKADKNKIYKWIEPSWNELLSKGKVDFLEMNAKAAEQSAKANGGIKKDMDEEFISQDTYFEYAYDICQSTIPKELFSLDDNKNKDEVKKIISAISINDKDNNGIVTWYFVISNKHVDLASTIHENASEETKIKKSEYGLPGEEKFPLQDEKHIISAITYFRSAKPTKKNELAENIIRRVKELNLKGVVFVHPGNELYNYVPDWMKIENKQRLNECVALEQSIKAKDMNSILHESIIDLKKVLDTKYVDALDALVINETVWDNNIPDMPPEFITKVSKTPKDGQRLWNVLRENTIALSSDSPLYMTMIYADYYPCINTNNKILGGLTEAASMSDDEICARYSPKLNMYQCKGMLKDLEHIKFASALNEWHDDYMAFNRNPDIDIDIINEWNSRVKETYSKLQEATEGSNEANICKQQLLDLKWDCTKDPNDEEVKANNISNIAAAMDIENPNVQGEEPKDIVFVNNHDGSAEILQESIFQPISTFFRTTKKWLDGIILTIKKRNYEKKFYYLKWLDLNYSNHIAMYSKMNEPIERLNNVGSKVLFELFGITLIPDTTMESTRFDQYILDAENVKTAILKLHLKHNTRDFEGVMLNRIASYMIDDVDFNKDAPITYDQVKAEMEKIFLGDEITAPIHCKIFSSNTKAIPSSIRYYTYVSEIMEEDLIHYNVKLSDLVEDSNKSKEIILFKNLYESSIRYIIQIMMDYIAILMRISERMDAIYTEVSVPVHESVTFKNRNLDEEVISLLEAYSNFIGTGIETKTLVESIDAELYKDYLPLFEAVDEISNYDKNDLKEDIKEGKMTRLIASLTKLKNYMFKLDPDQARHFLPEIIKYFTRLAIVAVATGLAVSGFGIGATTFLAGVINHIIGMLVDIFDNVLHNGLNQNDIDKSIEACQKEIEKIDKAITDGNNKENTKLLNVYKVRLNHFISDLEEARVQKEMVGEAKNSVKNKVQKSTKTIKDTITNVSNNIHKNPKVVTESILDENMNVYDVTCDAEALNEGVIGNAIKNIKEKIKKKIEENNKLRKENQKNKDAVKKSTEPEIKKVLKSELKQERDDFKNFFYSTLNKYPMLKKMFEKENEIYDDSFEPTYYYNIVYGDIYGDITDKYGEPDDFSEEIEKQLNEFHKILSEKARQMKYHTINIEYQVEYYFYQLYEDKKVIGVDILDENVVYDVTEDAETLNESIIGKLAVKFYDKFKEKREIKQTKKTKVEDTRTEFIYEEVEPELKELRAKVKKYFNSHKHKDIFKLDSEFNDKPWDDVDSLYVPVSSFDLYDLAQKLNISEEEATHSFYSEFYKDLEKLDEGCKILTITHDWDKYEGAIYIDSKESYKFVKEKTINESSANSNNEIESLNNVKYNEKVKKIAFEVFNDKTVTVFFEDGNGNEVTRCIRLHSLKNSSIDPETDIKTFTNEVRKLIKKSSLRSTFKNIRIVSRYHDTSKEIVINESISPDSIFYNF